MEVIKYIQNFSNPSLDFFFSIITNLGGQTIGIVIAIILFWCINKKLGYKFSYAILFSFSLNNILKGIFNAPRPIGIDGIQSGEVNTATGSSFPSGHSQGNATTFAFLMGEYKNKFLWSIGIFMLVMVPLSRLYFGVHWPKDVIAGTIIGLISVVISNKIFDKCYGKTFSLIIYYLILFLILGLFFPSNDLVKALGAFTALIISLIIETKYISFNPKGSIKTNILKCFIGITGLLIIYILFSSLIYTSYILNFFKYFSMSLWTFLVCPYIFIKLKLANKNKEEI